MPVAGPLDGRPELWADRIVLTSLNCSAAIKLWVLLARHGVAIPAGLAVTAPAQTNKPPPSVSPYAASANWSATEHD